MGVDEPSARASVEAFLDGLDAPSRGLGATQWGLTLPAGGWPLDVGLTLRGGLLTVAAFVLAPGQVDASELLHRHRDGPYVRYALTRAGELWLRAELPEPGVSVAELDRLLGVALEAAETARGWAREG